MLAITNLCKTKRTFKYAFKFFHNHLPTNCLLIISISASSRTLCAAHAHVIVLVTLQIFSQVFRFAVQKGCVLPYHGFRCFP